MDLPESSSSSTQQQTPWVILGRVALVEHDSIDEPGEVSVRLAAPPRAAIITVPMSLHAKPNNDDRDKHPYVVAANSDTGLLLIHVSQWPFVGFDLDENPKGALLVVRGFRPAKTFAEFRDVVATATTRIPDRALSGYPGISNIKSVGLLSRRGGTSGGADDDDVEFVVAELRLNGADDTATLLSFRSGSDAWVETELSCPSMYGARQMWSSHHDVVAHDGKLWWVNLAWGLLGCDPFEEKPTLRHVKFPESIADRPRVVDPPTIECNRMVTVSRGRLLFVKMVRAPIDTVEETTVVVQSLQFDGRTGEMRWRWMSGNSLGVMWATYSYRTSGMPAREVPVLALVNPSDPDEVYFFLKDYIFGFDMTTSRVTEFIYKPGLIDVVAGTRRPPPISWRYVIAWELPALVVKALDNDVMDEDADSPVEDSGSSSIPDLNDSPATNLGETPMTDLDVDDTPKN